MNLPATTATSSFSPAIVRPKLSAPALLFAKYAARAAPVIATNAPANKVAPPPSKENPLNKLPALCPFKSISSRARRSAPATSPFDLTMSRRIDEKETRRFPVVLAAAPCAVVAAVFCVVAFVLSVVAPDILFMAALFSSISLRAFSSFRALASVMAPSRFFAFSSSEIEAASISLRFINPSIAVFVWAMALTGASAAFSVLASSLLKTSVSLAAFFIAFSTSPVRFPTASCALSILPVNRLKAASSCESSNRETNTISSCAIVLLVVS